MAALTTAIIASAAIGSGAALYSGAQGAKAAKKAGQAQQAAAQDALKLQREQYAYAFKVMEKYGVQGDWARDQMSAFLGGPATGGQRAESSRTPSPATDWGSYYRENLSDPSLGMAGNWERNPKLRAQFGNDRDAYARYHFETFGEGEGRTLPGGRGMGDNGGPPMDPLESLKTPDQRREEAWDNYTKSPFAAIARRNADRASEDFTSMAGAQGSALAGRTARGMAEARDEMEQDGFGNYYSALSGMADTGFRADGAAIGAGQNFADSATQIYGAEGDARANGIIGQADAWNSALSDVAGWAGWAAGAMPGASPGATSSTSGQRVLSTGRSSTGGGRTGGMGSRLARVG